jgi:hypothetical protein
MNMHCTLQHRVWSPGIHEIRDRMDHFIAPDTKDRRAQYLFVAGID